MGLVGVTKIIWPQFTFGGDAPFSVLLTLDSANSASLEQMFVKSMAIRDHVLFQGCRGGAAASFAPFRLAPARLNGADLLAWRGIVGRAGIYILLTACYRHAGAFHLRLDDPEVLILGFHAFVEILRFRCLEATRCIGSGVAIMLREHQLGMLSTAELKKSTKDP